MSTFALFVFAQLRVAAAGDACDGVRGIEASSWLLTCPAGSEPCDSGRSLLFRGCCCKNGTYWDAARAPDGALVCQPCGDGVAEDASVSADDWPSNVEEPWWWPQLIVPSPLWLRQHLGGSFVATVLPFVLRLGVVFIVCSCLCNRCRKKSEPTLRPGALAWVSATGKIEGPPVSLTEEIIADRRVKTDTELKLEDALDSLSQTVAKKRGLKVEVDNDLEVPLAKGEHYQDGARGAFVITLVEPDVTWMTFNEYYLALSWNPCLERPVVVCKLFFWHLAQCGTFLFSYLAFYDRMNETQRSKAFPVLMRECVYLGLLLQCLSKERTRVFLLYWPPSDRSFRAMQFPMFVFQPEKWLLWLQHLDQKDKGDSYFFLLACLFVTDLFGILALADGLVHGTIYTPMLVNYSVCVISAVLFIMAWFGTGFFKAHRHVNQKQKWINAHRAEEQRARGKPLHDVLADGVNWEEARLGGYTFQDALGAGIRGEDAKLAGYVATDWKRAHLGLRDALDAGFTTAEAKEGGYDAKDWRDSHMSLEKALLAGFQSTEARAGGYLVQEWMAAQLGLDDVLRAGFSDRQAKEGGYSLTAWREAGKGLSDVLNAGFTGLEARVLGYEAKDWREAGQSVQEVVDAGFTTKEAKAAGYNAKVWREAGKDLHELLSEGFSEQEALQGGYDAPHWRKAGKNVSHVVGLGFTGPEVRAAGYGALCWKIAGMSLADALAAGYSEADCRAGGFTVADWREAGRSLESALGAGFSGSEARQSGYGVKDWKAAGKTVPEVFSAGFSNDDSRAGGYGAKEWRAARMELQEVLQAGFSEQEARAAGYDALAWRKAGKGVKCLLDLGFPGEELRAAGYSALDWKIHGHDFVALHEAGYTDAELATAYPEAEPRGSRA